MPFTKEQSVGFRARSMRDHHEWAVRQWENAFNEDWDYEYLLLFLRAKLTTMARYNLHLSYAVNGLYYAHQIQRAIRMIDIILQNGGKETALPHVNMKNRSRIPATPDGFYGTDEQRLRFDKAWMLLWKILSEQLMNWGD